MRLRDYLRYQDMSYREFAELIDYSPVYINQLVHGVHKPGRKIRRIIENVTSGEVKGDEIYSPDRDYKKKIGPRKYAKEIAEMTTTTKSNGETFSEVQKGGVPCGG